jgi:hypothetical protein
MIKMVQPARREALERLDIFAGEWVLQASFPSDAPAAAQGPAGPQRADGETGFGACSVFEWALDGRFLIQRTEVRLPGAPDSLAVVAFDPGTGGYTQHYFDSRGTARLYAMSFAEGTWELLRDSPDFSPLDFSQRFTGTFSDDGDTIRGRWEKSFDGSHWEHDFDLTYRRVR